jgi:integrase
MLNLSINGWRRNMRVNLKGINRITKRLADGSTRTYWYAWKGGPPLRGEPGSAGFVASYNEAVARKVPQVQGTLQSLLDYFQTTTEFTKDISERTREDYKRQIKIIEQKFGDFPLAALTDPRTRGIFKEWRDELAIKSARQADYAWVVLARVLSVGLDRGKIKENPCAKGGRLYASSRVDNIWTLEQEETFINKAPAHLHLPLLLALWSGQREGDLLRLPWSAYDGTHIRLRPRKTITKRRPKGTMVVIPVGAPLKAVLDEGAKHKIGPVILTSTDKRPWTPDGFRASWGKACNKAGITGVTFNDLRGTAVTRLALVGCSEPEIASITGHSLRDVRSILDQHYLHRDPALAASAIRKLEAAVSTNKTG